MPIHNADIAAIFEEIADLLEIRGENPFRIRAYRNAARGIGGWGRDVAALIGTGMELPKLPGIGADLTGKIHEIVTTGRCKTLDKLRAEADPGITALLRIPGLGPKRVQALNRELGISTVAQLREAARGNRVREVAGFGAKTEQRLLKTLAGRSEEPRRFKLAAATEYADSLAAYLQRVRGVERVEIAGSYRRMKDAVGDLDILVTASSGSSVMKRFVSYDEVGDVLAQGETKSSVLLRNGLQVDLRLVPAETYGAALHYFTGSKAHNIAIRRLAQARGLKLNEYGVFRGKRRIAGDTEQSVFAAVGLPFIEPELREDLGEIEAARAGRLPHLVTLEELRGDLHVHTQASDGRNTIREMALAAQAQGLSYIAITEHSRRLTVARGLDPQRLERQMSEIDGLNADLPAITVLKGIEVDILEDGTLDLPDAVLARLDIVIAAVHSKFDLTREQQTKRILRALDDPHVDVLAHPGGRLIGSRDPYEVDMLAIVKKAKRRRVFLELNSQPARLDIDDTVCRMARGEGATVSINSDAHHISDFSNLRYGVGQARRGWLESGDVLNTRGLSALRAALRSGC